MMAPSIRQPPDWHANVMSAGQVAATGGAPGELGLGGEELKVLGALLKKEPF